MLLNIKVKWKEINWSYVFNRWFTWDWKAFLFSFKCGRWGRSGGGIERCGLATSVWELLSLLKWLEQFSILFTFVGMLYNTSMVPCGIKINKCRHVHWRITIVFLTQTTHVLSLMSGSFFFNASPVYQWNITFQINWYVVWIENLLTIGNMIKQVLDLRWFICMCMLISSFLSYPWNCIRPIQACVRWAAIIDYNILDPPILQSLSETITGFPHFQTDKILWYFQFLK